MQGRHQDSLPVKRRCHGVRTVALSLWVVLALCTLRVARAEEPHAEVVRFDIPAGPATDTLPQYIAQTGLQVVFPSDDVRGIVTNEVRGDFGVKDALERMTLGTRLRFEFIYADAVTVTVVPPAARRRPRQSPDTELLAGDRRSLYSGIETITVTSAANRPSTFEVGSLMLTLTRADIEAFPFKTVADVIRTLPQVFGGGPTEDTRRIGFEAQTNAGTGAGVNLRGLGAGSTLVLVNGRRLAGGGSEGIFTDIMSLPLSLIERIEILPDSSSTVYGADAVGGVVNFVLRDSMQGGQTEASFGAATRGQLNHNHVAQLIGFKSPLLDGLLALDFSSRDNLPSADREQARSDLRVFGGDNFDTFASNPATILVGGRAWAVPRGQDGSNLTQSSFIPDERNLHNLHEGIDLLPSQQRWSLYATGKKALGENVRLFADALYSQRDIRTVGGGIAGPFVVPRTNGFYASPSALPLPVVVNYDFTKDLGNLITNASVRTLDLVAGTELELPAEWNLTATGDFARERLASTSENSLDVTALNAALADPDRATAFNPFGDGSYTNPATLAGLRSTARLGTESRIWTANLTARREVAGLRGGTGKFVSGIDFRRQEFSSNISAGAALNASHNLERKVEAAFAALSLPILGKPADAPGANRLEVSVAGRYERYSDFGHITTPRFALTFAPQSAVTLRGTWSKSFRPPNLLDLDESSNLNAFFPVINPSAPGGQSLVLVQSGKNAALHEERARSWTLGANWDVEQVPGLSAALTYFNTTFMDRMNMPLASTSLLTDPSRAYLVTRDPSTEARQAVCDSAPLFNAPAAACMTAPIAALVDLRVRNSALMKTNGIDLLGQYERYLGTGQLTLRLDGTYLLSFSESATTTLPLTEKVSTQNSPIDLRLRGTATWESGPWGASALLTYFDDYRDVASRPERRVDSWTTLDVSFAYSTDPKGDSAFSGLSFSLGAENVFDTDPPFLNNPLGIGYDQENGELTGRIVSVSVRKTW